MSKRFNDRKWKLARRKALRSLALITDEEDEAITRAAEADPDNPPIDQRMFARMRPATDAMLKFVQQNKQKP